MPQLDPAVFVPQLIWLAITFIVLYVLMARLALPRVGRVIEQRHQKIEGDLAEARRMKIESETVLASYERALSEARAEAQHAIRETMERLNEQAAERQREASAKLAAELAAAEARLDAARAAALANLRGVAVEVAKSAVSRLIGGQSDEARAVAAVDAVLKARA